MSYLKTKMNELLGLQDSPENVAMGFSLGIVAGATPFVPLQTFLAIGLALLFRKNKVASIIGSVIIFPALIFIIPSSYYLFSFILGYEMKSVDFTDLASLKSLGSGFIGITLGSIAWGIIFAVPAYFILKKVIVKMKKEKMGTVPIGKIY